MFPSVRGFAQFRTLMTGVLFFMNEPLNPIFYQPSPETRDIYNLIIHFFPTSELPSSAYSSPCIPSIPAPPAPNVAELVIISLASTLPEVHLLPSVPQHHHHPTVLALVLKHANIKYAASGRVASASCDAASQSRAVTMASAFTQDIQSGENSVVRTRTYMSLLTARIGFRADLIPTPPRSRSIALECMSPHRHRRLHVLTGTPRVIFLFPGRRSSRPSSSTDAATRTLVVLRAS
ncbi:hypothetical protein B0H13DRAFT_2674083 [Mycena leptocephala]|nr:hypothetical protein B0H13DRAFT_2674083 [Mycena leptocephala]